MWNNYEANKPPINTLILVYFSEFRSDSIDTYVIATYDGNRCFRETMHEGIRSNYFISDPNLWSHIPQLPENIFKV